MNQALVELGQRGDSLLAVNKKSSTTVQDRGRDLIRTNKHETTLALVRGGLGLVTPE